MLGQKAYKILFITLSNIGDCILTLPVLDLLSLSFAESEITVMVAPRPKEIFLDNPMIKQVIIYDKKSSLKAKIDLFNTLKRENFDIVVDLKNTLFGQLLPAAFKAHHFLRKPKQISHMRDVHLSKILYPSLDLSQTWNLERRALYLKAGDLRYIENLLKENGISENDKVIVVSAGARSQIKRWPKEKFADLINKLGEGLKSKIILIGDQDDIPISKYITQKVKIPLLDITGKTSILQAAALLRRAYLLITNDSANLHLASYLNIPVVAIFGPTDETKYGPWSTKAAVVKREIFCRPCMKAQCRFRTLECMQSVGAEEVLKSVRNILLATSQGNNVTSDKKDYRRILIVRTDKVGDVILSTPVIKALRDAYPFSYIAMMIRPYTRAILEGNPYLDEIIIYDKEGKEKSWWGCLKFAWWLRKQNFALAIVLNPSNRGNLITFLAGISKRIGYNRKLGFLLTDKIKDVKHLGQKHEIEYSLDLVRHLGIEPKDKHTFMPVNQDAEKWAEEAFKKEGIKPEDKVVVLSPGASDQSKTWPLDRYAVLADKLSAKGYKIVILGGPGDKKICQQIIKSIHSPAVQMVGNNNISQAASLLRRSSLFISTDTGPMHLAASVGIPLVAIFGRNQPGLSALRWGPQHKNSRVLHKDVGCKECLAHNCEKDFLCLQAISVEDVLKAAGGLLEI